MPKPVPKWKPRVDSYKKDDNATIQASTSGLSGLEKENIPIDVDASAQINTEMHEKISLSTSLNELLSEPVSEPDKNVTANAENGVNLSNQSELCVSTIEQQQEKQRAAFVQPVAEIPNSMNLSLLDTAIVYSMNSARNGV
ncbi:OLC1v1004788C1 [Oldenlandia corymbosa var. corymbosa]|uniref:OLC1v1004788C1 n=1 Tax=Oldenlandia corymbosa var. corymbosa TaxID=529605 RepID=A0AAV1DD51_OLDCO|nr:OLC1v1004788C1 [Oldenlandia corymbosa var. corymbosa]